MQIIWKTQNFDYDSVFEKITQFRKHYPFINGMETQKGLIQIFFTEFNGDFKVDVFISPYGTIKFTFKSEVPKEIINPILNTIYKLLKPNIIETKIIKEDKLIEISGIEKQFLQSEIELEAFEEPEIELEDLKTYRLSCPKREAQPNIVIFYGKEKDLRFINEMNEKELLEEIKDFVEMNEFCGKKESSIIRVLVIDGKGES